MQTPPLTAEQQCTEQSVTSRLHAWRADVQDVATLSRRAPFALGLLRDVAYQSSDAAPFVLASVEAESGTSTGASEVAEDCSGYLTRAKRGAL